MPSASSGAASWHLDRSICTMGQDESSQAVRMQGSLQFWTVYTSALHFKVNTYILPIKKHVNAMYKKNQMFILSYFSVGKTPFVSRYWSVCPDSCEGSRGRCWDGETSVKGSLKCSGCLEETGVWWHVRRGLTCDLARCLLHSRSNSLATSGTAADEIRSRFVGQNPPSPTTRPCLKFNSGEKKNT